MEKCKSPAEPFVTSRDKHLPRIPVHKPLLPHIWRSQSVRLESTKPSPWLNMCAEYRTTRCTCRSHMQRGDGISITNMILFVHLNGNDRGVWIGVSLYVSQKEHVDNIPPCTMYVLKWCVSVERNMEDCQSLFVPLLKSLCACTATCKYWPSINHFSPSASTVWEKTAESGTFFLCSPFAFFSLLEVALFFFFTLSLYSMVFSAHPD